LHTLSATTFEAELPEIGEETLHALVVLGLRGSSTVGSSALNVLAGHAVMISTPGTQGLSLLSPARVLEEKQGS